MVHTLSIAVGIIAGLRGVVAQEPKNPFPADNVDKKDGFEGNADYHCAPFGVETKWNNTWYPPCRRQREIEVKCQDWIPEKATQEEKVKLWEKQRSCLCIEHKDYFSVAVNGCMDCKGPKGYNLEYQDNVDAYKAVFKKLSNKGYCEVTGTLEGNYAFYHQKTVADGSGIYYEYREPLKWKDPFTVPVSEYWNERPDGYDSKPLNAADEPAKQPAEGTANLPPQVDFAIGIAPAVNSTKFAASTEPVNKFFHIVKLTAPKISVHDGQKTVEQANPPKVFVNPLSAPDMTRKELNSKVQLDITFVKCSMSSCADQKTQQSSPKQLTDTADNNGATAPAPVDTHKKTDKHATFDRKKCRVQRV